MPKISQLTSAAQPLSGGESVLMNQNGVTVTSTLSSVKTYVLSGLSLSASGSEYALKNLNNNFTVGQTVYGNLTANNISLSGTSIMLRSIGSNGVGLLNYTLSGSGSSNIAIGFNALSGNGLNRFDNIAIGSYCSLSANGDSIVSIGSSAGVQSSGSICNFIGSNAGSANTGESVNAMGFEAAYGNMGDYVNALGSGAASRNMASNVNAFGQDALNGNIGVENINAFGNNALGGSNEGSDVNALGQAAGYDNYGNHLNALGNQAAYNNDANHVNALGQAAGYDNYGSYVNFMGLSAGSSNTGNHVNCMGQEAGESNNGDHNQFFGKLARTNPTTLSGCLVIGNEAQATQNNTIALGSTITPFLTSGSGVSTGNYLVIRLNGQNLKIPLYT